MKKILILILSAFMLLGMPLTIFAENEIQYSGETESSQSDSSSVKDPGEYTKASNGYTYTAPKVEDNTLGVYDFADLLTDDQEKSIRERITKIESSHKNTIMVLTTKNTKEDSTHGTSVTRAYAEDFYEANKDGLKSDALIFIIDMKNRVIYTVGFGKYADNSKYSSLHQEIYEDAASYASSGDYNKCINVFLDRANALDNILKALVPTTVSLLIGLGAAGGVMLILLLIHAKSAPKNHMNIPVQMASVNEKRHNEIFLGRSVTSRPLPKNDNHGGPGGGGGFSGGGGMSGGGSHTSGGGGHF